MSTEVPFSLPGEFNEYLCEAEDSPVTEITLNIDHPLYPQWQSAVGEGHAVQIRGMDKYASVGAEQDRVIPGKGFATIIPYYYTNDFAFEHAASGEAFTTERLISDKENGLVEQGLPIVLLKMDSTGILAAYHIAKNVVRTSKMRQADDIRAGKNLPESNYDHKKPLDEYIEESDRSIVITDYGMIKDDKPLALAEQVPLGDNPIPIAIFVDNDTGMVELRPANDDFVTGKSKVAVLELGPVVRMLSGAIDFSRTDFKVYGPEKDKTTRAAGVIVQSSGVIEQINDRNERNPFYDIKIPSLKDSGLPPNVRRIS